MAAFQTIINYIKQRRTLAHLLYWIGVILYIIVYSFGYNQPVGISFYIILVFLPVQILASYTFLYYQIPLLFKKKYLSFFFTFLPLAYLFYLIVHFNYDFGVGTRLISWHKPHTVSEIFTSLEDFFRLSIDIYIVVFVTAIIKFVKDYWASKSRMELLHAEVAQVQYNSLVAKIEPQLVLDTLDLIIDSSEKESKNTPEIIASMSEVLDGVLYKSRTGIHSIKKEVDHLEQYLNLLSKVYPSIKQASFEKVLHDGQKNIKALGLQKVIAYLFKSAKTQLSGAIWETLIMEQKDQLIVQISISELNKRNLELPELNTIINTHFEEDFNYDILENEDEYVVKLMKTI